MTRVRGAPRSRRLLRGGLAALLLGIVLFAAPAWAQYRETTGRIDRVTRKMVIVDNRMQDKLRFVRTDESKVEGEKAAWEDLAKGDWVVVFWTFDDKPRKAHLVKVIPPNE